MSSTDDENMELINPTSNCDFVAINYYNIVKMFLYHIIYYDHSFLIVITIKFHYYYLQGIKLNYFAPSISIGFYSFCTKASHPQLN